MRKMTIKKFATTTLLGFGLLISNNATFSIASAEPLLQEDKQIPAPRDVGAIPHDARVLPSGVAIRVLAEGDGKNKPTLADDITIHYTGWQTDGKMFDSSRLRGKPSTFPLGRLIQGWQLAVPEMSKNEIALIWIPGHLAYDNRPDRPDAPKGMLVFEIELIDYKPSGQ